MAVISIAPILQPEVRDRRSFTDPTGTYYAIGTPSVALAADLIAMGIRRVVLAGRENVDWVDARALFIKAGVEIRKTIDTD